MVYHYTLKFKGSINRTFKFDVYDTSNPLDWDEGRYNDLDKYIEQKSDGYLYIQNVRITNKAESIHEIYKNLSYNAGRDNGVGYIDSEFSINSNGIVVCTNHYYGSNQGDRIFSKFAKLFGI